MPLKMFMIDVSNAPAGNNTPEINHLLWIFFAGGECKYEPIFAVREDGEFIPLTKDETWEKNPIYSSLKKAKQENLWDICMRQTMKMLVEGVEAQLNLAESQRIAQKISRMPKCDITSKTNDLMFGQVANYLSQVYGELSTAVERRNEKRKNLTKQLEYYIASEGEGETPFSREADPKEAYPALRIKRQAPLKAIVCVDVSVYS